MKRNHIRTVCAIIFLLFISSLFGMSRRPCLGGHFEFKPVNMFVYYPMHVVYLSYEAYADGKYLLAGISDSILLLNFAYCVIPYDQRTGMPISFAFFNLLGLAPLMINSYVSFVESLNASDNLKMYRSLFGIAMPIVIACITDWKVDECVDDTKTGLLIEPILVLDYVGVNMEYEF